VLSYAPQRHGRRWPRRLRLVICIAAVAVALVLIANQGLDIEQWGELCVNCGAHSYVQHVSWHGISGNHARRIKSGYISQWIESQDGRPCVHKWEPTSGEAGMVWPGHYSFTCRAFTRDVHVRQLEVFSSECIEQVFRERLADPQFLAKFRKEVLAEDREEPNLYRDLLDSLMACYNNEE
jgi:hypothetical protein